MKFSSSESRALLRWLEAETRVVCEADPAVISKYILALLKKDKSPEALREGCLSDLQDFLGAKTRPFVERLFDSLRRQSYMAGEGGDGGGGSRRSVRCVAQVPCGVRGGCSP